MLCLEAFIPGVGLKEYWDIFGEYACSASCRELDESIDSTLIFESGIDPSFSFKVQQCNFCSLLWPTVCAGPNAKYAQNSVQGSPLKYS